MKHAVRIVATIAMLSAYRLSMADQMLPTDPFVLGYADQLSYTAGEELSLHASTNCQQFDLTVERIGQERIRVLEKEAIPCAAHSIPDQASSHGCQWPVVEKLAIDADWTSGYYEIKLTAHADGKTTNSTLFFVVRESKPGSRSKILLQLSTNTYNAYTVWGGHSLYAFHDRDGLQGHHIRV